MVEPVGYVKMWEKFENDVYMMVKRYLKGKFDVKWSPDIRNLTPDIVMFLVCKKCEHQCTNPVFIFEAYNAFKVNDSWFKNKDSQMKKYSKICDSFLVLPQGYRQRAFCKSENGEYSIISFHKLPELLKIIKEIEIQWNEDACGESPYIETQTLDKEFELILRSKIDKCPHCKSQVFPISLIHCSKYNEYFNPDCLSFEMPGVRTFIECDGCGDNTAFFSNYMECIYSGIEFHYQCKKCGAIFNPENEKIIKNFIEFHLEEMVELGGLTYYKKVLEEKEH